MLYNYLLIAWRNLFKRKLYTSINIFGLSLGVSACMVIFALVYHLKSFDSFHTHAVYTYRVVTDTFEGGREYYSAGVPAVFKEAFLNEFPGVDASVFISASHNGLISISDGEKDSFFEESNIAFTSNDFFNVFDRAIIQGPQINVLNEPNQAIISSKYALKLFGREDVLGKTFQFNKKDIYVITAIMKDYPSNSDFPFEILLSYENIRESREIGGWTSVTSGDQFYVVVQDDLLKAEIESGLPGFVAKYFGDNGIQNRTHSLQPLNEIHFDERYGNYNYQVISYSVINTMMVVGIFLVLTASINFINLSTAISGKRSKEVGLRKVFGGSRSNIITQFMTETSLISLLSLLLSSIVTWICIQYLNEFLGVKIMFNVLWTPIGLFALFSLWVGTAFISGFYPSFSISKLNPVAAIKNQYRSKNTGSYMLRKGLVIFQFVITQFFIMGTLVLVMQMNHIKTTDLGFTKEAVVSFDIPEKNAEKTKILSERLKNLSGIDAISISFKDPASSSIASTDARWMETGEDYIVQVKPADESYIITYGLDLLYGENLIKEDTASRYLVTESFATKAGYKNPEDILGKYIKIWDIEAPIIGVVRDFYTSSLKSGIEPTVIFQNPTSFRTVGIKISQSNAKLVMADVERIFAGLYPEFSFDYSFLDDRIALFYDNENKLTILFIVFSIIAVLLGCIGLYGLVSFIAVMKVKEIGVRKVLGASSAQILVLFSKEYLALLLVAFLISAPMATILMEKWLSEYASRISISWQVYFLAILMVAFIAILTVGYRSLSAAWANPANSLQSE